MAKKSGKKPDKPAANGPGKKAEKGYANLRDKKIYLAVGLVALVIIGCAVIIGSNLLNTSPSPALPADTLLNATPVPTLPADNLLNVTPSPALPADTNTTLSAFYFYGNGCIHCDRINPLVADIQARYPELHLEILEVNDNRQNFNTFLAMNRQYEVDSNNWAIPTVFIGKKVLIGEIEIKDHFEEYILAEKQRIATGNTL
jgi:thiol-disulfide isomerase/thioredoxin